jgi:hypothetical protein
MDNNNFEIGDRKFKVSKINAMKQFHIVRRIGPILGEMMPAIQKIAKSKEQLSQEEQLEHAAEFVTPIMNGLSRLSDKDADFVLFSLLAAVEINQDGAWSKLVVNDNLMFDMLGLPVLLQAAGRAFMYNMTGFFGALRQSS